MMGKSSENVRGVHIAKGKHFYRLTQSRINKLLSNYIRCNQCGRQIKLNDSIYSNAASHRFHMNKFLCELCALAKGFITMENINKLNSDHLMILKEHYHIATGNESKNKGKLYKCQNRNAKDNDPFGCLIEPAYTANGKELQS